jgi:methionine synthase II (cobalamin-independent)
VTRHVHFVGSIGLDSVEEVFTTAGGALKQSLKRCPDGEVGGRKLWISYQWPVLRATSFLEPASDQAIPGMGLCTLRVRAASRPDEIHFGELGYAREARTSYGDFLKSRSRGTLGKETRFQVCLPTPAAVIGAFVRPQDIPRVLPAYTDAMLREVQSICSAIPHQDLAIQWDVCIEMIQWDARSALMPPFPGMEHAFAAAFAALTAAVPDTVELGIHLCYGDMDAKHFIEPVDLSKAVSLANLISKAAPRPLNWIHMPVPMDRDDAAYFSPLQELARGPSTDLYLGLVHAGDGAAGTVRRMKAASAFASTFGIATECGMGRSRTPQLVRELLGVHAEAARAFP